MEPIRFFISYSHQNELWIAETLEGNAPNPQSLVRRWRREYPREDGYEFWYDREKDAGIRGGDKWRDSIFLELDRADVAILLISDEFRISGFIRDQELPRIVQRANKGELEILPVYVEPAQLEKLDLPGTYQITPGYPTPLSAYLGDTHKMQTALIEVSRALERVVQRVQKKRPPDPEPPHPDPLPDPPLPPDPPPPDPPVAGGPVIAALARDIGALAKATLRASSYTCTLRLTPDATGMLATLEVFFQGNPTGTHEFRLPDPLHDFWVDEKDSAVVQMKIRSKGLFSLGRYEPKTAHALADALTRLNALLGEDASPTP